MSRLLEVLRCSTCLVVALALPRAAAGDGWQQGPGLPAAAASSFDQVWCKVALAPDGQRLAAAWATVVGHEVKLRFFDGDGQPTSAELLVNEGFTEHRQDEPMLSMDAAGRTLVCWSDRKGYDGSGMGVFGRVYDSAAQPLGPPFVISQDTTQSQWEPMPAALPGGGWLVAFNGEDDGEAWFRRLAADGTPLGGDVNLSTFHNNAQVDAAVAVTAEGVVLAAFVDFGGNGPPGSLTNVFLRRFLPDGTALDSGATLAHASHASFDQIEPRLAANGLRGAAATLWLVWQDGGNDGSGQGVFGRLFDQDGAPRTPVLALHQTSAGDQLLPEVACDHVGNAIVTWEDRSTGTGRVLARVFRPDGTPASDEILVASQAGEQRRPQARLDASGERAALGFEGPGAPGQAQDAWLQIWTRPALTLGGEVTPGGLVTLDLDLPGGAGWYAVTLASFGGAGIALPDGRVLPLDLDPLFEHSLAFPDGGLPFLGFQFVVPPGEAGLAGMDLPANPVIVGLPLAFAALTLDLTQPGLLTQLRHVTAGVETVIR